MNNTAIIKPFDSDSSNIANIKTQIMTTITDRILKSEPMIRIIAIAIIAIIANYTLFTVII